MAFARGQGEAASIHISGYSVLTSDRLNQPHGLTFLGNDHLVVCNRAADVCIYRIPLVDTLPGELPMDPVKIISSQGLVRAKVKSPGSVTSYLLGENQYRILVCNDQWHFVSAHKIILGESVEIINEGVLIEKVLKIPDGICVSPDRAWLAISNHVNGAVLIFENTPKLNRETKPAAVLQGMVCPHGLDFDADGNLFVADSASPYLFHFEQPKDGWWGKCNPSHSIRVLDNETFYTGRYAAREGGVKGLYVVRAAGILITTHKLAVLEFHDLSALKERAQPVDKDQLDELRLERDADLVRNKTKVMNHRLSLNGRLIQGIASSLKWRVRRRVLKLQSSLKRRVRKVLKLQVNRSVNTYVSKFNRTNRISRESILDSSGPVVSLTTHSTRIRTVHLAIESIAHGVQKPSRLILWISEPGTFHSLPPALKRLQDRGLELRLTEDMGPHTKYYPYLEMENEYGAPLVTADDDVFYPPYWLETLMKVHRTNPSVIHCYRVRLMRLNQYHFEPYSSWNTCSTLEPSHLNFILGVDGVIYPFAFLNHLKSHGNAFIQSCPTADDIWLTYIAYREGFKIAPILKTPDKFPSIPGTQLNRLSKTNVNQGGNQIQLAQTFTSEDRTTLYALQANSSR